MKSSTAQSKSFLLFPAAPLALAMVLLTGCDKASKGLEPDKIALITQETQLGLPGATQPKGIRLEVLSKACPKPLGGAGEQYPVAGERVIVVPVDPASGIQATPAEGVTDQGGGFSCAVTLGKTFGDQYLDIVCPDSPEIRKRVRFVAGVTVENDNQEVAAGDVLPKPVRIKLTSPNGAPITNEPVYFTLAQQPGG